MRQSNTDQTVRWEEVEKFFEEYKRRVNDPEHLHMVNVIRNDLRRKFGRRITRYETET